MKRLVVKKCYTNAKKGLISDKYKKSKGRLAHTEEHIFHGTRFLTHQGFNFETPKAMRKYSP